MSMSVHIGKRRCNKHTFHLECVFRELGMNINICKTHYPDISYMSRNRFNRRKRKVNLILSEYEPQRPPIIIAIIEPNRDNINYLKINDIVYRYMCYKL